MNTEITKAIAQLERSERGQRAAAMLFHYLNTSTVQGLDGLNQRAIATLVNEFMIGSCADAGAVMHQLQNLIDRHPWLTEK